MAKDNFREKLRIKFLKILANQEETEKFVEYFDDCEPYINKILNNEITPDKASLEEIIQIIKYRKSITLKQKI